MQSYRNLYPTITAFANLHAAFRRARKGKRDRAEVAAFEVDLEANLFQLQADLQTRSYRPGSYRNFYIRERKLRLISAAPFCDRVVHHALCAVINPIWERRFIHDTYANRPGKGTHKALDRAQHFARGHPYVLQCDVHQFFPAIDHAILYDKLAHHIRDADTLWLIEQILAGGAGILAPMYTMEYFPGDDLFAMLRPRGLPVGNLTSQSWANIYWIRSTNLSNGNSSVAPTCAMPMTFCSFIPTKRSCTPGKKPCRITWPAYVSVSTGDGQWSTRPAPAFPFWAFASFPPIAACAPTMYGWRVNGCSATAKPTRPAG